MNKQRGFFDFDFTGFFIGLLVLGAVIGWFLSSAVPFVWGLVKPFIHSLTA